MPYNVPAVYEVLGARIGACVARPGHPKSGVGFAWEWQSHDLAKPEPEAAISRRKRIPCVMCGLHLASIIP